MNNKQLKQFTAFLTIILVIVLLVCFSQLSSDNSMDSIKQLVSGLVPFVISVVWVGYVIVKNNVKPYGDITIKLKVALIGAVIAIALYVILSFILGTKI